MRTIIALSVLASIVLAQTPQATPPAAADQSAPRDAKAVDASQTKAIAALRDALERGKTTVAAILGDRTHDDLHDKTPFRELIAKHANSAPVTMAAKDEPGKRLVVSGRVEDGGGKPVAGALVYAYHTDARGYYGYERAHVGGNEGDFRHARLFAYVRTDENGEFTLHTIRPASYPGTDLPQHIHFEVTAKGMTALVTEILFADDPKLDDDTRAWASRARFPIVDVAVDGDDERAPHRCRAVLTLRAAGEAGR